MADLRNPVMADISYDRGDRRPQRGDYAQRRTVTRSVNAERQKAALLSAVEFDIVPQLLSAHQAPARKLERVPAGAEAVASLTALALGRSDNVCAAYTQTLLDTMPLDRIYLEVVAPAADRLRKMWIDDERGYAEVTLGLWRLQQVLRDFSPLFRQSAKLPTGQRVMLTLPPGETHELPHLMFMLVLSGEFLRRDGWNTWIEPDCTRRDAMALLKDEWFDVVEFLVTSEKRLDLLAAQIKIIRGESTNRTVCIALAGTTVQQHPALLKYLGADVLAAGLDRPAAPARSE